MFGRRLLLEYRILRMTTYVALSEGDRPDAIGLQVRCSDAVRGYNSMRRVWRCQRSSKTRPPDTIDFELSSGGHVAELIQKSEESVMVCLRAFPLA
jgi:hypothetical protein